ncbi:hypothetical protein SCLCIDRAFT_991453 [Scleroderma citrinum Foug A]|uniref:Uncharacterized protein n=1 Tax=Scleroderma citrinum Foug A TaxID=1036808 RepID=A0A0C3DG61_9AGAM|nr:hypothetical protein SCLCIDRAFT_991453 [Scleroderma citrinum Foug A]
MKFSKAHKGIKLGDYGCFTDFRDFCHEGNIFAALESLHSNEGIAPRQHLVSQKGQVQLDHVWAHFAGPSDSMKLDSVKLYKPLCLSLPTNDAVKTLLTVLSIQLPHRYLVTRVIQCPPDTDWADSSIQPLCAFAKPIIWNRNEGAGSVSE